MYDMSRWYIRLGNWCFNIVLLNILWIVFSGTGFFIFGIFPATAALFLVLKKMIMEDENTPIISPFFKTFKSEFIKSNVIGYIFLIIGSILYVNLRIIESIDNNFLQLSMASITVVIAIVFILTFIYIFPIFVHFNFKLLQYPVHALVLAIAKPLHTFFLLVVLGVISYLFFVLPELILIFGFSGVCFVIMKVTSYSLPKKYQIE